MNANEVFDYSQLYLPIITFILGIIATLILSFLKRRLEKDNLIEVFVNDIYLNWKEVSPLITLPSENTAHRSRFYLKGYKHTFIGSPELSYEVYNIKFFESEGLKLIHYIGKESKKAFWKSYTLLRDAEATRTVLHKISHDDKDRESYILLFNDLVKDFADSLIELQKILQKEYSIFKRQ